MGQDRFTEFCVTHGFQHLSGSPIPLSESTLEMFAAHLASSVSYRTVKNYLSVVRSLQIDLCHGDPLVATPHLEYMLQRIRCAQSLKSSSISMYACDSVPMVMVLRLAALQTAPKLRYKWCKLHVFSLVLCFRVSQRRTINSNLICVSTHRVSIYLRFEIL